LPISNLKPTEPSRPLHHQNQVALAVKSRSF
jgi:hypothetical protein